MRPLGKQTKKKKKIVTGYMNNGFEICRHLFGNSVRILLIYTTHIFHIYFIYIYECVYKLYLMCIYIILDRIFSIPFNRISGEFWLKDPQRNNNSPLCKPHSPHGSLLWLCIPLLPQNVIPENVCSLFLIKFHR